MTEEATQPGLGTIGKYQLVEVIGEGAMGKVYRAFDPVLSRAVAIKLMSASIAGDAHLRDRFLREARAAANLQHPNVITIYDFGDADGHPYIAMEFVEGSDLAHLIDEREALSLASKLALVIGILHGLGYAHSKGVVHRDIKPANIRVTADGRVKIMDFGIAHLQGSEITHSGAVLGTPDYMAPEQVRGLPVTAQADIFAAGAVLYEILTWEKPFTGDSLHAVLFKVVSEEPTPMRDLNPSLPEHLERIVATALHKEPARRYPTAQAMAADLLDARERLSELETSATIRFSRPIPLPPGIGLPAWWARKEARYALAGAGGVLTLAVALWAVSAGRRPEALMARAIIVSDTAPSTPTPGAPPAGRASAPRTPRAAAPARRPSPATARPSRPAAARPATRAEVEQAVGQLERAFESRKVTELRRVYPTMRDQTARQWDEFFRNKNSLDAIVRIDDLQIDGPSANLKMQVQFVYVDGAGKKRQLKPSNLSGTLAKTTAGLVWRTLTER